MFDFLNIARALSDANRVRILLALRAAPLCVCQITALLDLAPSTTSKHLSVLRQSRLIESTKQGRWVYYTLPSCLPGSQASPVVQAALDWALGTLKDDPGIAQDAERIADILQTIANEANADDPEHLFCHSPELHLLDQSTLPDSQPSEGTKL